MMEANLHEQCTNRHKEKHKSVKIFSNLNISKETSDRKIGDKPDNSIDSKRIKTATVPDISQKANVFPSVQEYRLKNPKTMQYTI